MWLTTLSLIFKAEKGGFKTVVMEIKGNCVYSKLKFESGVHRVQRVPQTEAQGRVHTSTATVAIMPEVDAWIASGFWNDIHAFSFLGLWYWLTFDLRLC